MCFGKVFHLILMHFISLYSMLWGVFSKIRLFSLKCWFSDFRLIRSVFLSIEIVFKISCEPLSVSINRNSWIRFLKNQFLTCSKHFFKKFSNFPLSLRLGKAPQHIFCRFPPNFLQGFSLHKPICPLYPFFFIYFQFYMHFFMHWRVIFELCINWGFWCFKPNFVKLINGFCWYIVIFMIYVG